MGKTERPILLNKENITKLKYLEKLKASCHEPHLEHVLIMVIFIVHETLPAADVRKI